MTIVTSGLDYEKKPCEFYLDENLKKNLDLVKDVVLKKDFDYVALVCGLPGLGKSNFAQSCAKYCCPSFDETFIAFDSEQFINLTNTCPSHSAVILDESFASLNSKVTMTADFVRIINHLQIIRQRNLFVFLCLPNFFDLNKGIAIYRSSHLFVCYGREFGDRGSFAGFGREEKKKLYILGSKFMNYQCVKPNFRGRFVKQKAIDEEVYKSLKLKHLQAQQKSTEKTSRANIQRDILLTYMHFVLNVPTERLMQITGLTQQAVSLANIKFKEEIIKKYSVKE
jgi:hypothetical protein